MLLSAPQVGAQALPPAVSFQFTPLFVGSFCTFALRFAAGAPAVIVVIGLLMLTVTDGAGLMVIFSEAVMLVSLTSVAVTVAVVVEDTVDGELYVTVLAVWLVSVPGPVSDQVTDSDAPPVFEKKAVMFTFCPA